MTGRVARGVLNQWLGAPPPVHPEVLLGLTHSLVFLLYSEDPDGFDMATEISMIWKWVRRQPLTLQEQLYDASGPKDIDVIKEVVHGMGLASLGDIGRGVIASVRQRLWGPILGVCFVSARQIATPWLIRRAVKVVLKNSNLTPTQQAWAAPWLMSAGQFLSGAAPRVAAKIAHALKSQERSCSSSLAAGVLGSIVVCHPTPFALSVLACGSGASAAQAETCFQRIKRMMVEGDHEGVFAVFQGDPPLGCFSEEEYLNRIFSQYLRTVREHLTAVGGIFPGLALRDHEGQQLPQGRLAIFDLIEEYVSVMESPDNGRRIRQFATSVERFRADAQSDLESCSNPPLAQSPDCEYRLPWWLFTSAALLEIGDGLSRKLSAAEIDNRRASQ
jgi:hypothetical protein